MMQIIYMYCDIVARLYLKNTLDICIGYHPYGWYPFLIVWDTVAENLIRPHRIAPLAKKAGVSRSLISAIEAPGLANGFSLEVFFDIADALEIDLADQINASVFPDQLLKKK